MAPLPGVLALALLFPPQVPGPPTFAVGVENVNVDVLVTRGGRTVEGLTGRDFLLTDNGVRQQVEVLESSDTPVDAVLVLDASSSVRGERLALLRRVAHAFVDTLRASDSVTLVVFATELRVLARAGEPRSSVHAAIEGLEGAGRPLVSRQAVPFAFDWLLAAGALHQAYADHARAFGLYAAALAIRPRDTSALLARATALEFSVVPDGFGGEVVNDLDVWRLLEPGGEPPRELSYQLANPRTEAPYRRFLLEFLTRQYRDLLELDPTLTEARLRLGRVLEARGHRAEAEVELRTVAAGLEDPFLTAVSRLCLARLAPSTDRAAPLYRSALEVDPTLSPAWLGLSQSLHARGDRGQALAALERALSLGRTRALTAWVDYHLGRGRAFPGAPRPSAR